MASPRLEGRWRRVFSGIFLCLCWGSSFAAEAGESLLFEAEEIRLEQSGFDQCVQVGLFMTYRGSEARDWALLNLTLSYSGHEGILSRAPFARLSDFGAPTPWLSNTPGVLPSHSGDGLGGDWGKIIGPRDRGGEDLFFAEGRTAALVTESVNPATARVVLQASGKPALLTSEPNRRLLLAVISFPLASEGSGRIRISFTPDSLVKDGNALVAADGNVLAAYTLDGAVLVEAIPPNPWARWLGITAILLTLGAGVYFRFGRTGEPGFSPPGKWIAWAGAVAVLIVLAVVFYSGAERPSVSPSEVERESGRPMTYGPASAFQFEGSGIRIPGAHRYEARLGEFNLQAATNYLELGLDGWNEKYRCIGCHTNGIYLLVRPMLTSLGPPQSSRRESAVAALESLRGVELEVALKTGHRAAQVVYNCAGLASWDRFVGDGLSHETSRAMDLMFRIQDRDGGWPVPDCWAPLQSSRYQLACVAALALGLAPEIAGGETAKLFGEGPDRLRRFLRTEPCSLDYDRAWLLWAASRLEGLLNAEERSAIIEMITSRQRSDGGWSLRDFGTPELWAGGTREQRLVSEPEFYMPVSDGHMTGLAAVVLAEAGVSPTDDRMVRATRWIEANQRVTGRWWTSSLNSENLHLITYSGTCFCLLSLARNSVLLRPDP